MVMVYNIILQSSKTKRYYIENFVFFEKRIEANYSLYLIKYVFTSRFFTSRSHNYMIYIIISIF